MASTDGINRARDMARDATIPEARGPARMSHPADPDAPLPNYRPRERFWPYTDLPEQPDREELEALDPDLRAALYGPEARPFSFTLVFPKVADPDYEKAVALARESADYREVGAGESFRIRARFRPDEVEQLRDLFAIVGRFEGCEVLVDDRPLPYARELWLPLTWFLLPR